MAEQLDLRSAIFSPSEASTRGVQEVKRMEDNRYRVIPLPINYIGDYFAPLLPFEICAVQAQTHNFKSGFMNIWEHGLARYLASQGRDEVVIHVDLETPIESLMLQEIARESMHSVTSLSRGDVRDWKGVVRAAGAISGINIYRISNAMGNDNIPDLYLSNIYRCIKALADGEVTDQKLKPACIFIDYLQSLPIDPEINKSTRNMDDQRRLQVRQDIYRLRRMTQFFECPIVVGVQAKQALGGSLGPNMLIPGMYDGEETSSIAQRFDRLISLWMPKTTHSIGETLNHKGRSYDISENLLFVRVLKQRGKLPSGRYWRCEIDFDENHITAYPQ